MRHFGKLAIIGLIALSLSACAAFDPTGRSVLVGGPSLTASVNNPVTQREVAILAVAYTAAVRVAAQTTRLRRCVVGDVVSWTNVCVTRAYLIGLRDAKNTARRSLNEVRYLARIKSVNAFSAMQEAERAIAAFATIAQSHGAK